MVRALNSSLDFVLRDILPEKEFDIDFFDYIDEFAAQTGKLIRTELIDEQ